MSEILIKWLNEEIHLSQKITNISADFKTGYLFAELLYKTKQLQNLSEYKNTSKNKDIIHNFCLLDQVLLRIGINLTEEDRMDRNHRFRNPEYAKFIKDCFERDNYTCQITDRKSKGDIVVHHINGFNWDINNRTNINNGITLSNEIHKEFHKIYGKGNNTKEQFMEFIQYLYDNNRITLEKLEFLTNRLNNIK